MSSDIKNSFEKHKNFSFLLCLIFLFIDIYFNYYSYLSSQNLAYSFINKFIYFVIKTGLLNETVYVKLIVLVLTFMFVMLDRGKKNIELEKKTVIALIIIASIAFLSTAILPYYIDSIFIYTIILIVSYLYLIKSYSYLSRLLNTDLMKDRFNKKNKIFPQSEHILENDMSVNIPYKFVTSYKKNGKPVFKDGYINLIAPERAMMILGKPGSGKSYSFIEEIIRQHIMKGFSMINYDYKFPTLTNISYNYYSTYKSAYDKYENKGNFAVINLDNPNYSHRCNPVHYNLLDTKAQAVDAVYTLFFNIDKKSATKQDFFQMSAMSITSAALWFLRNYDKGQFCSLPHLIEFINRSDSEILPILDSYPDLRYFTSSFSDALAKESFEQLSGQTASARIPLGKLATDQMFWVMSPSENDEQIDLRVNMHNNVTILNIANNPDTQKTNGPALGLYMSQAAKLVNAQNRVPCDFIVDELPTIFVNGLNTLIATARSNKVCTVLSIQDYTQIVNEYGREQADTIFNTTDTIVSGKVAIETAEKVSKAIGKINYKTQSISVSKDSTSTSFNTQRELLVPPEDISQFSQGEFVGILSDTYKQQIDLKAFRGIVSPDKSDLKDEKFQKLNDLTPEQLKDNTKKIQNEISSIIRDELTRMATEQQRLQEMAEIESNAAAQLEFNTSDSHHNIIPNDNDIIFEDQQENVDENLVNTEQSRVEEQINENDNLTDDFGAKQRKKLIFEMLGDSDDDQLDDLENSYSTEEE